MFHTSFAPIFLPLCGVIRRSCFHITDICFLGFPHSELVCPCNTTGAQRGGPVLVVLTGLVGSSSTSSRQQDLNSPAESLTGSHTLAVPLLFASWPRGLMNHLPFDTISSSAALKEGMLGSAAVGGLATHVDVYATILKAAGVAAPPESSGLSLLYFRSALPSSSSDNRKHNNKNTHEDGGTPYSLTLSLASSTSSRPAVVCSSLWSHAVVTPEWKLAYDPVSNEGFLYARRAPNILSKEASSRRSRRSSKTSGFGWESHRNQWNGPTMQHVQTTLLRSLLSWRAQQHSFAGVWQQAGMRPAEGRDVAAARRAGRYTTTSSSSSSSSTKSAQRSTKSVHSSNSAALGGLKLNRAGLPRKARVVDSAFAIVTEALRGVDAELSLKSALDI